MSPKVCPGPNDLWDVSLELLPASAGVRSGFVREHCVLWVLNPYFPAGLSPSVYSTVYFVLSADILLVGVHVADVVPVGELAVGIMHRSLMPLYLLLTMCCAFLPLTPPHWRCCG